MTHLSCTRLLHATGFLMLSAPLAAQPANRELMDLTPTPTLADMPRGWARRAVRGELAPSTAIVDSAGERFLRIGGTARAAWLVSRLAMPIMPGGHVAWSWRVPLAPRGADLRNAASDDAAIRVFVVFARTGFFDRTPRTLFYSLGSVEPHGYARPSFQSRNLHVIRVGSTANAMQWTDVNADPFADYRRIWGGSPPDIVAIGVMQDTDQTRSAAVAELRHLTWSTSHAATP
jgi:Protein of unknown function (DUF3047)